MTRTQYIPSHSICNTLLVFVHSDKNCAATFPGHEASYRILELGCGVGNTIFPLLQTNNSPGLFVYGGDFSTAAIDIIKKHEDYDTTR